MHVKTVVGAVLTAVFAASPGSAAGPRVLAIGSLDGTAADLSTATSAPLENGIAGNLLGGIGSGLGHAGGDIFLALPDRGPNARPYNSCIDDTSSYIDRFQTVRLALTPNPSFPGVGQLPLVLNPALLQTTLLGSASPLVYGSGLAGCGVTPLANGAPAINTRSVSYFTGRSDNFDPLQRSTYRKNARFDPESIRVANNGKSVFISDEYGPYIYRFNRESGMRNQVIALPEKFAVTALFPVGSDEISSNIEGRVSNKGMEGLAITPDGTTLVGIMQSPLIQDGGTNGSTTRIVVIDIETGMVLHEYAYKFDNIGTAAKPKYGTASDILAVNDHVLLVDERDGKGLGDGSTAVVKRIYEIDLNGATDVSTLQGEPALAPVAIPKTLFLDVVAALTAAPLSLSPTHIPAKLEGMAFGDDVLVDGAPEHTLFIANDNDFDPATAGPNTFFVFGFTDADLKGATLVPQDFVRVP